MESVEKALREVNEFALKNLSPSTRVSVVISRSERFQPKNDGDWHMYRAIMHNGFHFDFDEGIGAIRELDRIVTPACQESHRADGYPKLQAFVAPTSYDDYILDADRWNNAIFSYSSNPNHLKEDAPGHPSGFQFELAQNYSNEHFRYYPNVPRLDGILQILDKEGVIEFLPNTRDEEYAQEYADMLKKISLQKQG